MTELLSGIASFVSVFLKSSQQLNVVHNQYLFVMPTSLMMAACEVFVISNIALHGWHVYLWLAIGFGAGTGCLFAMWFHKRIRHERP